MENEITIERWAHVCETAAGAIVVMSDLRASREAAEADPAPIFGRHLGVFRFVGAPMPDRVDIDIARQMRVQRAPEVSANVDRLTRLVVLAVACSAINLIAIIIGWVW